MRRTPALGHAAPAGHAGCVLLWPAGLWQCTPSRPPSLHHVQGKVALLLPPSPPQSLPTCTPTSSPYPYTYKCRSNRKDTCTCPKGMTCEVWTEGRAKIGVHLSCSGCATRCAVRADIPPAVHPRQIRLPVNGAAPIPLPAGSESNMYCRVRERTNLPAVLAGLMHLRPALCPASSDAPALCLTHPGQTGWQRCQPRRAPRRRVSSEAMATPTVL